VTSTPKRVGGHEEKGEGVAKGGEKEGFIEVSSRVIFPSCEPSAPGLRRGKKKSKKRKKKGGEKKNGEGLSIITSNPPGKKYTREEGEKKGG